MKFVIIVMCMAALALAEDKYDSSTDEIDLSEVFGNDRLIVAYSKCLMNKGPCTSQVKKLKGVELLSSSVLDVTSDIRSYEADTAPVNITQHSTDIITKSSVGTLSDLFSSSNADAATSVHASPEPNAHTYHFNSPKPESALLINLIPETATDIPTSSAQDTMSEHFNCCALDAAIEICFASDPVATPVTPSGSASEDESNVRPSSAKENEMDPTSAIIENSTPTVTEVSLPPPPELSQSNNNSPLVKSAKRKKNSRKSKQSVDVRPSISTDDTTNAQACTLRTAHRAKKSAYLDYMSDDQVALLNAFGNVGSSDEWEPEVSGKKKNIDSVMKERDKTVF